MQSYPSERSANVDCDEKIVNELKKNKEIEIYCLVYRYNYQSLFEEYTGFKVYRYKKGLLFDLYSWARHHEKSSIGILLLRLHRLLLLAKELILVPIYPYIEPVGMRQCAIEAIKLHKRIHFDLVFADHNGLDTLYAGKKLKDYDPNIKFIAMMWDPILGKNKAKYVTKTFHEKRSIKAQKLLVKNADLIIMLESAKSVYFQSKYSIDYMDRIQFCSIPGVIQPEENKGELSADVSDLFESGKFNIVYTGIITTDRDPAHFIRIIDSCSCANKINIVFFCPRDSAEVINAIKTNKVSVRTHDYIDKKALNLVYHLADGYLNLGGLEANMIPSKLFNYISYGKPIISTFMVVDDPSVKCLRKYPLSYCVDMRAIDKYSAEELNSFIECKGKEILAFETVQQLYHKSTPSVYVNMIQDQMGVDEHNGKGA